MIIFTVSIHTVTAMTRHFLLLLLLLPGAFRLSAKPLPKEYVRDSLPVLAERCRQLLETAYMADSLVGETDSLPGWEGLPVRLYEYRTGPDIRTGQPKKGKVYLLNPSPEKLARWIATACWKARGSLEYRYTDKLLRWIRSQSGGQFPVRGVVYEAMYEPGRYDPYVFKDGVTVYVADPNRMPADGHCTDEQLEFYLRLTDADLKPYTGRYARIASTTREQYRAAGGTERVGDSDKNRRIEWLDVVRRLYRQAWESDENRLITAWAEANL